MDETGTKKKPGPKPGAKYRPRLKGLLKAMRAVFEQPEEEDEGEEQRNCRAWLAENRQGFMAKMAELEKAGSLPPPTGEAAAETAEAKEAEANLDELIGRCLARAEAEAKEQVPG